MASNGPASDMWASCEQRLSNARIWNERYNLGFAESDYPELPNFAPTSSLEAPVLAIYLPDKDDVPGYIRTARVLWQIARDQHLHSSQWEGVRIDQEHLHLLPEAAERHKPGIRWVGVDFGANWEKSEGVCPTDVRGADSVHAEALAEAAHSPEWVRAMDGTEVPFIWQAGYQLHVPGAGERTFVPILNWYENQQRFALNAGWSGCKRWYYSIPTTREL